MSLKDCKYLFLDRDGVINVRKMGGYILSYDEFVFINGVKEAFKIFSSCFDRIFIITNQQGIGKGLMKEEDFLLLSNKMIDEIKQEGGRVDKIYFCSALKEEKSKMRKPEIGMGLKAKEDFK
jgi:histidinol-phosphate phosphatase family protein